MKKYIGGILSLLSFAAPLAANASASGGNCMPAAVKLTPSDAAQTVTLVREWDPYGGADGTGGWPDEGYKDMYSYVKWYYVDLAKGADYVAWIEGEDISMNIEVDYDPDEDDPPTPDSRFATYGKYLYITSSVGDEEGQWSSDDPGTCRFYICFAQDGKATTGQFYFRQASISAYAPAGSDLNPIPINVASDDSTPVSGNPGEDEVYYKFSADPGFHYLFTCSSSPTNMPIVSLVSLAGDSVDYNEDVIVDADSGVYRYDISVEAQTTVTIKVSADNPALCSLSWMRTEVGTAGFAKQTVQVVDDAGYAEVSVTRTSRNVALRYEWMTVAETAVPGVDYTPMRGELVFEQDGELTETIRIPIVPGASPTGGAKSFAVRLLEIDELKLEEDEYSPVPSPNVARVVITPTGEARPSPSVPPADDEDVDTPLSTGTFEGVVTTEDKTAFAKISLSSASDGSISATVALDGQEYIFTGTSEGTNSELVCSMKVAGETFKAYLYFMPPDGTVADLAGDPADAAAVSGSLFVVSQGAAVEKFFSGSLYRVESRLDTPTLERMALKAGRYVTALGSDWQPSATDVAGCLTVDVEADGTATGYGSFADGTKISFESSANDIGEGVAVPVAWGATNNLAGTLVLGDANGYDYWSSRYRLYNGWKLVVSDEASTFDGLEVMFDTDDTPVANRAIGLGLDLDSGVLTGSEGNSAFAVVLYTSAAAGEVGAAGYEVDGDGKAVPLAMQRAWLDPDWGENWGVSVTVSFDADGGTGTMPQIVSSLGNKLVLPECEFTRADHRFVGWAHPYSGIIYQPGDEVNAPAANSTFKAVWENVRLKIALDCEDLAFATPDDTLWLSSTDVYAVGGTCLSVKVSKGIVASVSFTAPSDGALSFNWAMTQYVDRFSVPKDDRWELYVGSDVVATLTADSDWATVSGIELLAGQTVEWRYIAHTMGTSQSKAASAKLDAVVWEPADPTRVTVTFDAGEYGTSSVTSVYRHVGEEVGALPTATRPGCSFDAWVMKSKSKEVVVTPETIVPVGGLSIFARWSATVSFDGNGDVSGNVPQPMETEPDVSITLPNPDLYISDDFEFLGWRLGERVYAPLAQSAPIMSNVTFVAEWKDNTPFITVTLDANGGTCDTESIEVKAGSAIDTLPTPTYDNAAFAGWFDGDDRVELPYTVGRSNVTMTAHWGFTVSFDAGGASGAVPGDIAADPGEKVVLPGCGDLVKANHAFVGWTDGSKTYAEGASYTVASSVTLTAAWKNTFYNSPLDCGELDFSSSDDSLWEVVSDGSAVGGSCLSVKVSKGIVAKLAFTAPSDGTLSFNWALTRYIDRFVGTRDDRWELYVGGDVVATLTADSGWTAVSGVELLAGQTVEWRFIAHTTGNTQSRAASGKLDAVEWVPVDPTRVTVTFDAGEYGVSSVTSAYGHAGSAIGEDIDPLPTATRDGCEFVAWVTASNEVVTAETTVPEGGFTLFARWSATVSFDGNGDVTGNVPQPMAVEPGETIVLPDSQLSMSNDFLFVGWRLGSKVYAPSAQSDPIMSNVTFVAEWKDNTPFITVALDANGGVCDTESIEVKAGGTIETLPTPTYDGAAFVGWFCAGERVELPYAVGASNITLTAHWGVTVSFDAGGASGAVPDGIAAEPGDKVKLPGCGGLAKEGYSFVGWSDGTKTHAEGASYTVASSVTLTAVWKNAFYNSPLDCGELDFSSSDDSLWEVVSDGSAVGGSCLSVKVSKGIVAKLAFTAPSDGTLSFNWALTRYEDRFLGKQDDKWEFYVDGVLKKSLTVDSGFDTESGVELLSGQVVEWRLVAHGKQNTQKTPAKAFLDNVVWESAGPTLDDGPFANASAEEKAKVLAWGDENGATIADINTMEFGKFGDPQNDMAAAYLLNCATNEVAAEAAKFAITEFSVAPDGTITIVPADGDEYGNGTVEARYSTTPAGPFTAEKPAADGRLFLRIYLVR